MSWLSDKLTQFQPQNKWHMKLSEAMRDCKIVIRSMDVADKKEKLADEQIRDINLLAGKVNDKITSLKGNMRIEFGTD